MTENGKEYWNNEASSWKDSRGLGDLATDARKCIREEIEPFLPFLSSELILNLGAGNDYQSLDMWGKEKVIKLDYARKMLNESDGSMPLEADVRNAFSLSTESVGMVTSFFLMRYLDAEQQSNLIMDASRVLKKGGHLVIIDVPNNKHVCQVEKFDPKIFVDLVESLGMCVKKCGYEERSVGKYISTGFGGWYEHGSYKVGVLVAMKM